MNDKLVAVFLFVILLAGLKNAALAQNIVIQPYLQNAEPSSMVIMWETDDIGSGFVDWGTSPFSLINTTQSLSQTGSGASLIHTAQITGLQAASKYYYKVRTNSGELSALYHFQTPPEKSSESTVQLIAISDMQRDNGNPDVYREITEEGLMPIIFSEIDTVLSELDAILIPGDLVATGGSYSQWQDHFFNPSDSLTPFVPLYPVPGNHEYFGGGLPNFIKYFDLPLNGATGLEEQCWFKDLSNVRIIGLNSNSGSADQTAQLNWLDGVLQETCADEDIDFVFAELHHPYKSELWTPGENNFTGEVISRLESFTDSCGKASVHFFGHTHGYSRGQSRDHQHLWVNVATAGGNIDYWGEFSNADYEEFVKSQDEYGFVYLESTAGDDAELMLRRYSRGDEFVPLNNVIRDQIIIRQNEFGPHQPNGVFPDLDTVDAQCLTLKASDFNDPGDIHQASHWQISTGCDFADSLVTEHWKQSENWYFEVDLQNQDDLTDEEFPNLTANQNYCWRVRYRDQYLKWSEWSTPKSFYITNSGMALTTNVIVNGGAEDGTTAWTGDIESLLSNECNSVPAYQDSSLFGIGGICANEMTIGLAHQVFDMTPYAGQISLGNVSLFYSAFMRDYSGSDIPEFYVEFHNEIVGLIETTPSISNVTSSWNQKSNTNLIPANATEAQFILKGTRIAGTDNDSYFDEIFAKLTIVPNCSDCLSAESGPGTDADLDGFCEDLDCNDQDSTVYPGAIELCDGKDNNCDGKTESALMVTWTGDGDGISWGDDNNWDQDFEPLPCQHVYIGSSDSIFITTNPYIKSLHLDSLSTLVIASSAQITIDGNYSNNFISAQITGSLINHGRCYIKESQNNGLLVSGILLNTGKIFINEIIIESLNIPLGGKFTNLSELEARN